MQPKYPPQKQFLRAAHSLQLQLTQTQMRKCLNYSSKLRLRTHFSATAALGAERPSASSWDMPRQLSSVLRYGHDHRLRLYLRFGILPHKVSPLWCDIETLTISKEVASYSIPLGNKIVYTVSWSVTSRVDQAG